jgi:hypothetical protein
MGLVATLKFLGACSLVHEFHKIVTLKGLPLV